jgi:biotin operon repressor
MNQIQQKGIRTLSLLEEKKWTLDELADKLCICKRYAQSVIKHLKDSGYGIKSRTRKRVKYFWMDHNPDFIPAILTPLERQALDTALTTSNPYLKAAIYKITQYTNVQLYLHLNK